jgi:hypothetical protein
VKCSVKQEATTPSAGKIFDRSDKTAASVSGKKSGGVRVRARTTPYPHESNCWSLDLVPVLPAHRRPFHVGERLRPAQLRGKALNELPSLGGCLGMHYRISSGAWWSNLHNRTGDS